MGDGKTSSPEEHAEAGGGEPANAQRRRPIADYILRPASQNSVGETAQTLVGKRSWSRTYLKVPQEFDR